MLGLSIILILIAALGKAICDATKSSFERSIFYPEYDKHPWVDPEVSWRNKYKGGVPANGERFFGAKTFLVWITDLWHFAQLIWLNSFIAGIILYIMYNTWHFPFWIHFLILALLFKICFEIFYRIILNK